MGITFRTFVETCTISEAIEQGYMNLLPDAMAWAYFLLLSDTSRLNSVYNSLLVSLVTTGRHNKYLVNLAFARPLKYGAGNPRWDGRDYTYVCRVYGYIESGYMPTFHAIANISFGFVKSSNLMDAVDLPGGSGRAHKYLDVRLDPMVLLRLVHMASFALRRENLHVFVVNGTVRFSTIPSVPSGSNSGGDQGMIEIILPHLA